MDANFKEKSTLLTFIAMAVTFGNYFGRIWFFPNLVDSEIGFFFSVVVIFIVLMIVLHIGLAMGQSQEQLDERDQRVSGKAFRNAHHAFIGTLVMSIGALMFADISSDMTPVNLMLLSIIVGELVYLGSLLVYYRKGA